MCYISAMQACVQDHQHDAKCMDGAIPAAGATSWEEIDAAEEAQEAASRAHQVATQFQSIVTSILYTDLGPTEKAARIEQAAAGLAERMRGEVEDAKAARPGIIGRLLGARVKNSEGLGPDDYAIVPDPEKPSTWKLRIDDAQHISGAIQALSPAGFRGQRVELEAGERTKALARIRAAVGRLAEGERGNMPERLAALKALDEPTQPGHIALFAGKTGDYERFALWSSNNFEDREGEAFAGKAIEAAVARFNARQAPKGHANVWHVGHPKYGWPRRDMTDWGEIEHAAYVDGFLLVEGRVTDPAVAAKVAAWGEREALGTSIEYEWQPGDLADGVYNAFDFDRVSVVPRSRAANPWGPDTTVYLGKPGGGDMIADQTMRGALAELYGEDQVKAWEAEATAKAAELTAAGKEAKALRFELPAPTIKFVDEGSKDDGAAAPAADATSAAEEVAGGGDPVLTAAGADEPPAWARDLLDKQAAILSRLDQTDAAVKAVRDDLDNVGPAAGVLGRSVQHGAIKEAAEREAAAQDAAVQAYKETGIAPSPMAAGNMADWGVAGKIAAAFGAAPNGGAPAGD